MLSIDGLPSMAFRMQVAHRLLRTATEAEAHFNLGIEATEASTNIHGILGQTFRADHAKRAAEFTALTNLIHAPIVLEAEWEGISGRGVRKGPHAGRPDEPRMSIQSIRASRSPPPWSVQLIEYHHSHLDS